MIKYYPLFAVFLIDYDTLKELINYHKVCTYYACKLDERWVCTN